MELSQKIRTTDYRNLFLLAISLLVGFFPASVHAQSPSLPTITVSPSSFDVSLQQNDSITRTMTLGNTGTGSLKWSIAPSTTLSSSSASVEALVSQRHRDNILPKIEPSAAANSVEYHGVRAGGPLGGFAPTALHVSFSLTSGWSSKAAMMSPRGQHGAVYHPNGKIYVFGGYAGSAEMSSLEIYDPNTNSWTTGASMPLSNRGIASAVDNNGNVYAIGGITSQSYRYNPSSNTWSQIATMPVQVWEASAVKGYDGRIYVFGGERGETQVQIYNPVNNTWSSGSSMPTGRCQLSVVEGPGGYIYAIGGGPSGGFALNRVEVYDPRTDTWSTAANMLVARRQFGACLSPDGKIYTIGGKTDYTNNTGPFFSRVEIYNPATNTWAVGDSLPIALGELKAVASQNMIYAIGGTNGTFVNYNFGLTVAGTSFWSALPSSGTITPGSTLDVALKFKSSSLMGIYASTMNITNNDSLNNPKKVPISLTVTAGPTPAITVTPSSFNVTLQKGDSTLKTMTIGNTGTANLTWSLAPPGSTTFAGKSGGVLQARTKAETQRIARSVEAQSSGRNSGMPTVSTYSWQELLKSGGSKRILAWNGYSDNSSTGEFENTFNAIRTYFTDFTLDTTSTMAPSAFSSLLADKDVFIMPEQERISDLASLGSSFTAALDAFVRNGKTVIVMDFVSSGSTTFLNGTGLLDISILSSPGSLTAVVHDLTSPLVVGLPAQFTVLNGPNYHTSSLGRKIIRDLTTGNNVVTERDLGSGRIIYFGMDFYSYNSDMARLLANAVQSTFSTSGFISFVPASGTVAPGSSQDVTVKINASGLSSGTYSESISINNNDPANNPKNVPLNLVVTPGPSPTITVSPSSFNVSVQAGDSTTSTLTIGNTGVAMLNWKYPDSAASVSGRNIFASPASQWKTWSGTFRSASSIPASRPYSHAGVQNSVAVKGKIVAGTSTIPSFPLYGTNSTGIAQIDPTTGTILKSFPMTLSGGPDGLAFDGQFFYVLVGYTGTIFKINSSLTAIVDSIQVFSASTSIDGLATDGKLLYVMNYGSSLIYAVDLSTKTIVATLAPSVVIGGGIAYAGDRRSLFASDFSAGIYELDLSTGAVINSFSSPSGALIYGVAYSSSKGILVVSGSGQTYFLNPSTGAVLGSFSGEYSGLTADEASSSFLTLEPSSGSLLPGATQDVSVKFNSKGLNVGTYSSTISLTNNDPLHNPMTVPASMAVTGPTLTAVVPNTAIPGQTLSVAITGQNTTFRVSQASSTVNVNHVWLNQGSSVINATSVGVSSTVSLTASFTIPSSAPTGAWNINIEQPPGYGTVTFYNGFTIVTPSIVSVVPNSTTQGLSLPVTITGQATSFRVAQASGTIDASHVWFSQGSSTINAANVSVSSATSLNAYFAIPINALTGQWNVNVEQPASKGTVTLNNGFTINATIAALMSLSDTQVDFIGVRLGQYTDMTFVIRDSSMSTGNLSGSVFVSGSAFSIVGGSGSFFLTPGQAWYITLRFNASVVGFAAGSLTIYNNSINFPPTTVIPIRAYGVLPAQNPKRILVDSIHGSSFARRAAFLNLLQAAGHSITTNQASFNPSSYDYFIAAGQAVPFTSGEISQLQTFVNGGGNVLLLSDCAASGPQWQNELLTASGWTTGIKVESTLVHDATQKINDDDTWIKLVTYPNRFDPLIAGVDTLGVFGAGSLTVGSPATVIATTTSGGWTLSTRKQPSADVLKNGRSFQNSSQQRTETHKEDFAGAESPMSLIPIIAKVAIGKGRIIVTGDMDMFSNPGVTPGIRFGSNRLLALNIFDSLPIPTPRIVYVRDVPNDNGKKVFVAWKVDKPAIGSGIARFGVWRKDSVWTFLQDSVPAVNDTVFQVVAPTIYDSTKVGGMRYSIFRVSAHAANPQIFTISVLDSGYSVDNLVPGVPKGVRGSVQGGAGPIAVLLKWNKNADPDLRYYAVYRSEIQNFAQFDSLTFVGASADSTMRDSTVIYGKKYYYRIVAYDWSGNRSGPSDQATIIVTSVGRVGVEVPKDFSLAQNYPNPFNPSTTIRYGVPMRSRVKIEVFNTIGQRVAALLDDEREGGYYEIEWKASVASGVYMYRIEARSDADPASTFVEVKRMALIR